MKESKAGNVISFKVRAKYFNKPDGHESSVSSGHADASIMDMGEQWLVLESHKGGGIKKVSLTPTFNDPLPIKKSYQKLELKNFYSLIPGHGVSRKKLTFVVNAEESIQVVFESVDACSAALDFVMNEMKLRPAGIFLPSMKVAVKKEMIQRNQLHALLLARRKKGIWFVVKVHTFLFALLAFMHYIQGAGGIVRPLMAWDIVTFVACLLLFFSWTMCNKVINDNPFNSLMLKEHEIEIATQLWQNFDGSDSEDEDKRCAANSPDFETEAPSDTSKPS